MNTHLSVLLCRLISTWVDIKTCSICALQLLASSLRAGNKYLFHVKCSRKYLLRVRVSDNRLEGRSIRLNPVGQRVGPDNRAARTELAFLIRELGARRAI